MSAILEFFTHKPLLEPPFIGPKILSEKLLLCKIALFCQTQSIDPALQFFIIQLEHGLQGIVSSGRGPKQPHNSQQRFILLDGKAYLHRKYAYPPRICFVTVCRMDLFRGHHGNMYIQRYGMYIPDRFTHAIIAINVQDGQNDESSIVVADF